jgi:hypothetical protein
MSASETFFYMEGDTVPTQSMWLDTIRAEAAAKTPFAVLGSRYKGHNWEDYINVNGSEAEAVIPLSLQLHLNGNAVYVKTHSILCVCLERQRCVREDPPHPLRLS